MFPLPDDRPSPHLSSLALEQFVAQELARATLDGAKTHLAACEQCRGRLVSIEQDAEQFASSIDLHDAIGALLRDSVPATRAWYRRPSILAGATAALAACAVLVLWIGQRSAGEEPTNRSKSGLGFDVIRRDLQGHVGNVASGDRLYPGEAIRFRVRASEHGFLVIVGIDAIQTVTAYSPSLQIEAGVARVLDGSIILDATLGPERIVAVVCEWPISTDSAVALSRDALSKIGGDPRRIERIAPACHEASILIEKVQ